MKRLRTLKKRTDYLRARSGKTVHTRGFVLQSIAAKQIGGSRFGFTVTKKIGNAVERNRIRRRLKSAVRACLTEPIPANRDFVLIGKRKALVLQFAELTKDLENAMDSSLEGNKRSSQ